MVDGLSLSPLLILSFIVVELNNGLHVEAPCGRRCCYFLLHLIGMLAQAAYPLVVCLIMAATLDELFLHGHEVMTPVNLNAFIRWCATATEEELDKAFDKIYITVHHIEETTLEDLPLAPVRIERSDLDRIFTIP